MSKSPANGYSKAKERLVIAYFFHQNFCQHLQHRRPFFHPLAVRGHLRQHREIDAVALEPAGD